MWRVASFQDSDDTAACQRVHAVCSLYDGVANSNSFGERIEQQVSAEHDGSDIHCAERRSSLPSCKPGVGAHSSV